MKNTLCHSSLRWRISRNAYGVHLSHLGPAAVFAFVAPFVWSEIFRDYHSELCSGVGWPDQ